MARPTEYSDERAKSICDRLRAGNTRKASVESIGVAYTTFLRWVADNDNFATDVSRAEADAELLFATCVTKAARDGDARIALEWLKRRRRDEWGDNVSVGLDRRIEELVAELAGPGQGETAGEIGE